jgi:hypothetical protein
MERHGTKPLTAYYISAAYPGSIKWLPSVFLLNTNFFEKQLRRVVDSFDPNQTVFPFAAGSFTTYDRLTSEPYVLIITDQPLHVAPLGDAPFGAWIPVANAKVTIQQKQAFFASTPNSVIIKDEYPPFEPGVEYFENPREDMELPILDVVGKKTVIWTEDASAWLFTSNRILRRGDGQARANLRRYVAVVV